MPAERTSSETFTVAPEPTEIGAGARRAEDIYLWRAVVFDAIDEVQAGFLAGDAYRCAAELRAQEATKSDGEAEWSGLAETVSGHPRTSSVGAAGGGRTP